MAITILRNQPIMFHLPSDTDCGCNGKSFCQIISQTDPTQFQISSSDRVSNGSFDISLLPWISADAILMSSDTTNASSPTACDATATITATGYSGTIQFSLNGGAYQNAPGGVLEYTGLCGECYFVTAQDSTGNQSSIEFCADPDIVCGGYRTTDSVLPFKTSQLLNCSTSDFV